MFLEKRNPYELTLGIKAFSKFRTNKYNSLVEEANANVFPGNLVGQKTQWCINWKPKLLMYRRQLFRFQLYPVVNKTKFLAIRTLVSYQ